MVFVVNTSYRMAPGADVLYAGDYAWFEQYAVDALNRFSGATWTGSDAAARRWPHLRLIKRIPGDRLPEDGICVGGQNSNSGLQAICMAALCGAKRIALLGFDGGPNAGRTHWHLSHPSPLRPCYGADAWPEMFAKAAVQLLERGVEVVNCSPDTRLTCFDQTSIGKWTSS